MSRTDAKGIMDSHTMICKSWVSSGEDQYLKLKA